jgi:hypothetical protein
LIGGGGYHRSALIDAAINHIGEWWLIGTKFTADWMPTTIPANPDMIDITNQFICEGVNGGIISLVLFIWLIVRCFKVVGIAANSKNNVMSSDTYVYWTMGCAVLGHVVSMISVAYFDQIVIFWYLLIAMIAAIVPITNPLPIKIKQYKTSLTNLGENINEAN